MKPSRAFTKDLARQRVGILLEIAVATAQNDYRLAERQASIARRICLRYNVRLPFSLRRFFCHGCKGLLIPGLNCRVRLVPGVLRVTCLDCGHTYRRILN